MLATVERVRELQRAAWVAGWAWAALVWVAHTDMVWCVAAAAASKVQDTCSSVPAPS